MAKQHTFTTEGEYPGVFYIQPGYRVNAYNVISSSGKKSIYTKPKSIMGELKRLGTTPSPNNVEAGGLQHAARYFFSHQPNFQHGTTPYDNQAHHMIPTNIFLKLFDEEEQQILKQVGYDINNGHNLIYLPVKDNDCAFHQLPCHNGSHGKYDDEVKKKADDLSQKLQEYIDDTPCEKKDEIPKDVVDKLMSIQDDLWNFLKSAGPGEVRDLKPPT